MSDEDLPLEYLLLELHVSGCLVQSTLTHSHTLSCCQLLLHPAPIDILHCLRMHAPGLEYPDAPDWCWNSCDPLIPEDGVTTASNPANSAEAWDSASSPSALSIVDFQPTRWRISSRWQCPSMATTPDNTPAEPSTSGAWRTCDLTSSGTSASSHGHDEVTVTEDAQPTGNPEASSDSGRPQVRQFNWSPNQALTMMVP